MRQLLVIASFFAAAACGGISQSPECKKYLDCTEAVTPGSAVQYGTSYGEAGSCWTTDRTAADNCTVACVQGRMTLAAGLGKNTPECQ